MDKKKTNTFTRSILILFSGSILAQIIVLATSPILTRLFTVEEIGIYTFVLSFCSIFMAVINGRYDVPIVTEEREEYVFPLIKLALIIALFLSIVVTLIYAIYITWISPMYKEYIYTIVIVYLLLVSYGVLNILTAYNNRKKDYKIITAVYVVRTFFQNFGAVGLGFFKLGVVGLLLPYTVGQLMGIRRQGKPLFAHYKSILGSSKKNIMYVLKKHSKQPLYSAPAILANSLSYSSIVIFIDILYNMSTVGYYSISVRILGLPLALISGNVAKVFLEEASREFNATNQFYKSLKKTVVFQFSLAIPMVAFMMLFSPWLFGLFFGEQWKVAGEYVVYLAPMFGIRFIVSAISPGLVIANKQQLELLMQFIFIVASTISFLLAHTLHFSIEEFLISISIAFSIAYLLFFIAVFRYSKTNMKI
ncbi:lipopolysaccharide biosynthesis protein [Fictibacillus aquaticus]|uniref:Polysaccharide biosynthesis protein n=1 Tax=Fictibacillus aquaticus TaxID=2021314 RepID=A0A235F8D4_9BACL|nr:oligosaccharide flippase family protein [Fictibacillus aquaticus]OYD57611.1 hypothetical protein CGZ90_13165 [Fictibacillus aquaticus]